MTRTIGKLACLLAVVSLLGTTACASIPQRAWNNGRNLSIGEPVPSHIDFTAARMRQAQTDPIRYKYEPRHFIPFGHW